MYCTGKRGAPTHTKGYTVQSGITPQSQQTTASHQITTKLLVISDWPVVVAIQQLFVVTTILIVTLEFALNFKL